VTLVTWAKMPRSWSTNRALRCVKLFSLTGISTFITPNIFWSVLIGSYSIGTVHRIGNWSHIPLILYMVSDAIGNVLYIGAVQAAWSAKT
jgi:hypothetical protein